MKEQKLITRKDYMENSSELHHEFYLQFATKSTEEFVLNSLKVEDIKKALDNGDKHLNKIKIPFNNMGRGGSWWWDNSPINLKLARELGAVGANSIPSPSTCTCIGKAMAKELANRLK